MDQLKNAGNPNQCARQIWHGSLIAVLLIAFLVAGCAPAATRSDSIAEPQAADLRPLPAIISPSNVGKLTLLREWEVDPLFPWWRIIWFPDGSRFIVPRQSSVTYPISAQFWPGPMEGVHCFDVDSLLLEAYVSFALSDHSCDPGGLNKTDALEPASLERVVFNDPDFLYIIDGQKMDVEIIRAGDLCGGIVLSNAVSIPGRNEILIERGSHPGHQPPEGAAGLYLWKDGFCSPFLQDKTGWMTPLVVGSDGKYVFYYDDDLETRVYDIEKGEEVCHLSDWGLGFDQHNRLTLTRRNQVTLPNDETGWTRTVFRVDLPDCTVQHELFTEDPAPYWFSLHPGGELLAGETEDSLVIWDIRTGEKLYQEDLEAFSESGYIGDMAFSPDRRYLAVIWDVYVEGAKDKILLFGVK